MVEEKKPYLDPDFYSYCPPGADLKDLVTIPYRVDEKEWIATHSK